MAFVMIFSIISWNVCIESKASGGAIDQILDEIWFNFSGTASFDDVGFTGSANRTYVRQHSGFIEIYVPDYIEPGEALTISHNPTVEHLDFSVEDYVLENTMSYGSIVDVTNVRYSFTLDAPQDGIDYIDGTVAIPCTFELAYRAEPGAYDMVNNLRLFAVSGEVGIQATLSAECVISVYDSLTPAQKLDDINGTLQEQVEVQEEQLETEKGILSSITSFFGSFFQNLIDSVIGLVVPSAEELKEIFDRLNEFFSETFGFLYYPFELLARFVDVIINSDASNAILTFPAFKIMGYEVWKAYSFDLQATFNNNAHPLYRVMRPLFTYIRYGTGCAIVFAFINYLRTFFDKRFGGGGN